MQVLSLLALELDRLDSELHAPAVLLRQKMSLVLTEYGVVRA